MASAAHSIAQRRVPCAPGRPLSLMTFYPPGWECQAGRAFAAVRGRTRRRGGLRNAFTNFVAYAAGSDARRTFRRFPAPEALRGQARGALGGGLEGRGMPSGKALGRTSGRHASPLRGKARRIGIKKCQPSHMFLSLYQQPLPPFRRAEQHLPGADVHRQNRHVSVSPRKPPAMAICATSSSNRRKKHRSSLGTSPFGAPFGAHVIGSAPHCRWRTCPRPPPILCTAAAPSPLSLTNQGSPRPCRPHASLSPQLCRQEPPQKPNLPPRTAKSKHRPRHREAGLCSTQNAPGNTPGALPLTV